MTSWIPIRQNLYESPKTTQVARALSTDRYAVVGMMVRVWGWVGEHTADGIISDISPNEFDQIIGVDGLGEALLRAGWMLSSGGDILFPEWEQWNGQCAKTRLLDAKRKRDKRNAEGAKVAN